ncbi:hypothetical protein [Dokdonia sp.]|uniref:hypothetical protein n=1 Tax=Dokdonia sp. TaxID=2024995 RepID=UPI003265A6C7
METIPNVIEHTHKNNLSLFQDPTTAQKEGIPINEQIMTLYNTLDKNGTRGKIQKLVAAKCKRGINTVKNHWFGSGEFPIFAQSIVLKILKEHTLSLIEVKKSIEVNPL